MPRNSQGTYTLPAGNPVVPDTTIESSWANPTMEDIGAALTESLSRQGDGDMISELKIIDGALVATGLGFIGESDSGIYRESAGIWGLVVLGVEILQLTPAGIHVKGNTGGLILESAAPNIEFRDTDATAGYQILVDAGRMDVKIDTNADLTYNLTALSITDVGHVGMGIINPSASLHIVETSSAVVMQKWNMNEDSLTAGPILQMIRTRPIGSIQNGNQLALLDWVGYNDSVLSKTFVRVGGVADVVGLGLEQGRLYFQTQEDGALATRFQIREGVYLADATGGDQGQGTINATNYYVNGNIANVLDAAWSLANAPQPSSSHIMQIVRDSKWVTGSLPQGWSQVAASADTVYIVQTWDTAGAPLQQIGTMTFTNGSIRGTWAETLGGDLTLTAGQMIGLTVPAATNSTQFISVTVPLVVA